MQARARRRRWGKSKGPKWYALRVGRAAGVYRTWEACREQVEGFSGAAFQMRAGYGKRKRKKKKAGQAAGQGGGPAAAGGHGDGEPAAGGTAAAGGAEAAKKQPKPKSARQARQALKVRAKRNLKERIGALQSLRKTVKRNDPLGKSAVRDLTAKIKSAKAARRGLRKGTAGAAAKGGALLLGALDLGLGGGPEEEGEEGEEAGAAEGAEDMEMS